jgi:glutaredoxin
MLDEDFTREELFEQFPTARTFPQVRINGTAIGGYDNLLEWHTNK